MSETIRNSDIRLGRITSSDMYKIMSNGKKAGEFGKPFYTYIEEKNFERKLKRPLNDDVNARALSWGTLLEKRAFGLLGIDYKESSQETLINPEIDCHAGSPDGFTYSGLELDVVVEVKAPKTLKSFCTLVECVKEGLTGLEVMAEIKKNHDDGDKFYSQIVSNSILTNSKFGELVVYMPYKHELNAIRELAANYDGMEQWKFKWIADSYDEQLPHLIEGGAYENMYRVRFEIPQADKDAMIERIKEASKLLITL